MVDKWFQAFDAIVLWFHNHNISRMNLLRFSLVFLIAALYFDTTASEERTMTFFGVWLVLISGLHMYEEFAAEKNVELYNTNKAVQRTSGITSFFTVMNWLFFGLSIFTMYREYNLDNIYTMFGWFGINMYTALVSTFVPTEPPEAKKTFVFGDA